MCTWCGENRHVQRDCPKKHEFEANQRRNRANHGQSYRPYSSNKAAYPQGPSNQPQKHKIRQPQAVRVLNSKGPANASCTCVVHDQSSVSPSHSPKPKKVWVVKS